MAAHLRPSDLRALAQLAVDGTLGVTGIAEQLHQAILRPGLLPDTAPQRITRGITGFVYGAVRGVTRVVGHGLDIALHPVEKALDRRVDDPSPTSDEREAIIAALNGVLGDHLEASGNALAIAVNLQHADTPLALERAALAALPGVTGRVLVLVHGLAMNPRQWKRGDGNFGRDLAAACGSIALHLHYNTGRAIDTNGRDFAQLLQKLVMQWPVPVEEIVIVGHSMGGLVARSACRHAAERGDTWLGLLRSMVFLGTPHHGAALERGGHAVEVLLGANAYSAAFARLAGLRSAGIMDLRHGSDAGPLPAGVHCYAVAGVLDGRKAKLLGDGLVTVDSALGRHADPARHLAMAEQAQWIAAGHGHIELMHSPAVLAKLAFWLA
ncbi:MAG: alpha/beta fold hydrolase [Burkholderiales bacterium]|nr:alpha/beta fold hydrolase [Burkholderiales bacterium]